MFPCECTGPTGNGIQYSYIDSCGNLVLVYTNNFNNKVGNVLGPTGPTGATGTMGPTGPVGNGVEYMYMDGCCNLIAVMTNGSVVNVGTYCCSTGPTGCNTCFYYGENTPVDSSWPEGVVPTPTTESPVLGNVYISTLTGCMYIFDGVNWITCTAPPTLPLMNTIQDDYTCTELNVGITPSQNECLYPIELTTDTTTTTFNKYTTNEGSDNNLVNVLWPPPKNSSYLSCVEEGIYTITSAIDYNGFIPQLNTNVEIVFYVLDTTNNFTNQTFTIGTTFSVYMKPDYKLIAYLKGKTNHVLTSTNNTVFIQIKRCD